jgi:hypothetical protein
MPIGYFGPFELIDELGRGDTGIVYKARDPSQDRLRPGQAAPGRWRADSEPCDPGGAGLHGP